MVTVFDLKLEPCSKCGGRKTFGPNQRTLYFLSDCIKVRCNNCNDVLTIPKERKIASACRARSPRKQVVPDGPGEPLRNAALSIKGNYIHKSLTPSLHAEYSS